MAPYDEEHDDPGYAQGVQARLHAASEAARRGALGTIVRSVTAVSLRTPHTGALRYDDGVRKIPAAAVSLEDADLLARLARAGPRGRLRSARSRMRERQRRRRMRGRERRTDRVLGAPSTDGQASDDGAGCVAVISPAPAPRGGLAPRRTRPSFHR
jgi:hypothetical protein